jgi:hypothetical protein
MDSLFGKKTTPVVQLGTFSTFQVFRGLDRELHPGPCHGARTGRAVTRLRTSRLPGICLTCPLLDVVDSKKIPVYPRCMFSSSLDIILNLLPHISILPLLLWHLLSAPLPHSQVQRFLPSALLDNTCTGFRV